MCVRARACATCRAVPCLRYCSGKSEQIIGRYMKEKKPSKVKVLEQQYFRPGNEANSTHTVPLLRCRVLPPPPPLDCCGY